MCIRLAGAVKTSNRSRTAFNPLGFHWRIAMMPPQARSDPGHGSGPARYPGTFLLAFREAAGELNWQVRRWLGAVVDCADAEGREHQVGLENLYRRARRVNRS